MASNAPGTNSDINFKVALNDALRGFEKDFKDKAKSLKKNLANLTEIEKHDRADQLSWEPNVKADLKTYEYFQEVNELTVKANLNAKNALALATTALTYTTQTATNTALAAKALDKANFSVARLTSDVASIYAKLNSEDKGSEMTRLCKSSYDLTQQAAASAETATMSVLTATIEAAKSPAQTLLDAVTVASKNSDDLAASVLTNTQTAQANALAAYKTNIDKVGAGFTDELNVINETTNNNMLNEMTGSSFAYLYNDLHVKTDKEKAPAGKKEHDKVTQEIKEGKAAAAAADKL